jgi:Zn finger protein HypA/HybF involved in hydrogenase expression
MHEFSVATEICRLVEERAAPLPATAVVAIGLEMGDESGLEPDNLIFCLDTLLGTEPFAGATTELVRTPGREMRLTYVEVDDERTPD